MEICEDSDFVLISNVLRIRFVIYMFIDFKEGKIDRENYVIREDFRCVFENVIKLVVIRSVIDKRLSLFYKIWEDKLVKKWDLKVIFNFLIDCLYFVFSSLLYLNVDDREVFFSFFYVINLKDKYFSDVVKEGDYVEDVILFFYWFVNNIKICDWKVYKDEGSKDFNYNILKLWFLEINWEVSSFGDDLDVLVFYECGGFLENWVRKFEKNYWRENDNVKDRGLEDINILWRFLERK